MTRDRGDALADYVVVGEGPRSLLFLHGLGGDSRNWQPQFSHFAPDYRCIAWTLPGYGASPAMDALTWPNLSDMVARVMTDVGIESATIVGLSMGGYVAQQFAADHDERVDGLVLAATTAQFGRGSRSFAETFLAARLEPLHNGSSVAEIAVSVVPGLLSPDAAPEWLANAISSMSGISAAAYEDALRCLVTWDFVDYLDEIVAPTLCLAGSDDRTAPVAAVHALADGLPNAEFAVIADCNHLMNLDRPAEFNSLVESFLDRL